MLSSSHLRVIVRGQTIHPRWIDATDQKLLDWAESILDVFLHSVGTPLVELEETLTQFNSENIPNPIQEGLKKLLMDRCTFEMDAPLEPQKLRAILFEEATRERQQNTQDFRQYRAKLVAKVAAEMESTPEQLEQSLYADLKSEQKLLHFDGISPERLLNEYNIAVVQALLLRATSLHLVFPAATLERCRALNRIVRFHRLLAQWEIGPSHASLHLDGPLSLFEQTVKYGLQLALFFPHILQLQVFELNAKILWGPEKLTRTFTVDQTAGLKPTKTDIGQHRPTELITFEKAFAKKSQVWQLSSEPEPVRLVRNVWFPDFLLQVNASSMQKIPLEILGAWRSVNLKKMIEERDEMQRPYLILASRQHQLHDEDIECEHPNVLFFQRQPTAEAVLQWLEVRFPS